MAHIPAVCPACACVHEMDPHALPAVVECPQCGALLAPQKHGEAVLLVRRTAQPQEKPGVRALLEQAEAERRPDRVYALIQKAVEADPESFAAHRALLYHGKLYEAARRPGDYALIKSYLLHMYEQPEKYTDAQREERVRELFESPLLKRTCQLSGDADACLDAYLLHLAEEYLRIFILGRSGLATGMFGFPRSRETVCKICEDIHDAMCQKVSLDERLTAEQQERLVAALHKSFANRFSAE